MGDSLYGSTDLAYTGPQDPSLILPRIGLTLIEFT